MFVKFKDSELFYARQIWTLMSFQLWYEIFILKKKKKLPL